MNALVIDAKGDRSLVSYPSRCQLAKDIGANRVITIHDLAQLTTDLHRRGFYTIARIVVFKDDDLARSRQQLAVKTLDGKIFEDRETLGWTDPFNQIVWNYNIDLAGI